MNKSYWFGVLVGLVAVTGLYLPTLVVIESAIAAPQRKAFRMPTPPQGPPPRGRVRGGAQRSVCPKVDPLLTALVPYTTKQDPRYAKLPPIEDVWGYTTAAHPTLWFYVPYAAATGYQATFVLQDDAENEIYRSTIALPTQPGVIRVQIPPTASPLKVGRSYRWLFAVRCDRDESSTAVPDYVEGVIQRVELSSGLTQKLAIAPPEERFRLYADAGIWFDTISTLAELRQQEPQNQALVDEWQALLESINLPEIAKQPLVQLEKSSSRCRGSENSQLLKKSKKSLALGCL